MLTISFYRARGGCLDAPREIRPRILPAPQRHHHPAGHQQSE